MNPKDYKLIEGNSKCRGCCFDDNDKCLVGLNTEFINLFKGCWDEVGVIPNDPEYPDPDENIYLIWKKKR